MIRSALIVVGMVAAVAGIATAITMVGDLMDKNSTILGEELHQRKKVIMESEIKWCHDRGGTATVEIKKYKVSCSIPPRSAP